MNRDTEPSSLNESLKSPLKEAKPQTIISVQPIYTNFFQMIEKHVELLIKALNIDNLIPNFRSTYGIETKPFGSYRLKILEIISILIKIGKPFDFMSIFCKNKIFSFLMVRFLF